MLLNKAGKGELWGEAVLEPATTELGTFTESIYVKGGKTVKSGSYTGTGDFEGYVIDYQITRSKYVPTVSPCDDEDPPLHILDFSGYVYITD
jgi:hypothetical protein